MAGGVVEVSDDAALPRGEETEQNAVRVAISTQRPRSGPVPQRMARGRLHLQNFGASIGEHLRAVRPGQIIGEVEHPHSSK